MQERGIDVEWLERTILSPEQTVSDPSDHELVHHLRRIPEHGDRVLRVVLNNTVDPIRLVTIYFDRAMKGKL
jgi:hypothetical protein